MVKEWEKIIFRKKIVFLDMNKEVECKQRCINKNG